MKHIPIAALVYGPDTDVSVVLAEVVQALRERGVLLAGALQHDDGPCAMELELLPSGRRMLISQSIGGNTSGCRLDAGALAEAAALVRQAVDATPALVVFNKFGAQEAAGGGLREEMAAAVMAGVPVLAPVSERFLEQWATFTGGEFVQLACSTEAALRWWDEAPAN
jgi:hypothetical protein